MSEGKQFYRCVLCGTVVSEWDIQESKGCPKCKNNKIKPTELSLVEKVIQIMKHPRIWRWNEPASV
jgi:phage FluMu protein Com